MMPIAFPRSLAILLLRFAIWIAPHDTLDWGRGMLSELNHVEGNWSALLWSLGGAGVLAKHAALAVILPGSHRRTVSSASELFAKEIPMRKATLTATAACVIASLLFFLAPVFRQAFQVSLAQWHDILHADSVLTTQAPPPDPALEKLANQAEQNRDADALAFVAVRSEDPSEAARLADEAVHLDPNVAWIYATLGTRCPPSAETDKWMQALRKYDPQNALPYLIAAQEIGLTRATGKEAPRDGLVESPEWQNNMAAAFQSSRLDTYSNRQQDLDRRVLARYHVRDPFQAVAGSFNYRLPTYAVWYSYRYANSLLDSGQALASHGDRQGAFEKYWTVAHYDQMLGGVAGEFFVTRNLREAYKRLSELSEEQGNHGASMFYASLGDQAEQAAQRNLIVLRSLHEGRAVSEWNAFLIRLSGLAMLVCGGFLLACVTGVIVRSKSLRLGALRPSPLTIALGLGGAVGALLSSAVLYVSYRPYAEILQRFIDKGGEAGLSQLSDFLGATQVPLGTRSFLGVYDAVLQFWIVVTVLCALALFFALLIHFRQRRPSTASV